MPLHEHRERTSRKPSFSMLRFDSESATYFLHSESITQHLRANRTTLPKTGTLAGRFDDEIHRSHRDRKKSVADRIRQILMQNRTCLRAKGQRAGADPPRLIRRPHDQVAVLGLVSIEENVGRVKRQHFVPFQASIKQKNDQRSPKETLRGIDQSLGLIPLEELRKVWLRRGIDQRFRGIVFAQSLTFQIGKECLDRSNLPAQRASIVMPLLPQPGGKVAKVIKPYHWNRSVLEESDEQSQVELDRAHGMRGAVNRCAKLEIGRHDLREAERSLDWRRLGRTFSSWHWPRAVIALAWSSLTHGQITGTRRRYRAILRRSREPWLSERQSKLFRWRPGRTPRHRLPPLETELPPKRFGAARHSLGLELKLLDNFDTHVGPKPRLRWKLEVAVFDQ